MGSVKELLTEQVQEVLDSINAGVYLTDRDRTIVFWNKEAERVTGYSRSSVVGSRCRDGILEHKDKDGRALCTRDLCPLYRSMVIDKPSDVPVMVYARTRWGARVPLSTTTAPLHDAGGNVVGGIEVFRDASKNLKNLSLAKTAQRQMLSREMPAEDRISFDVEYAPVDMIGGDYYCLEELSGDRYALFLADVAGHGISAALYTTVLYSLVRECREHMGDPGAFLSALNQRLCSRIPEVSFITALEAIFDASTGRVICCSAGHTPPFIRRGKSGTVEVIESHHYPLGMPDSGGYEQKEMQLSPGDCFLAYTDGATEMRVAKEQVLGTEGFASLVEEAHPEGAERWLEGLYDALIARCSTHMPDDDITLVSALIL